MAKAPLTLDTPLHLCTLAVEEDDRDYSKYKHIHAYGCTGLRDPETVNFLGGKMKHLMEELLGYAIIETVSEDELEYLEGFINPCARRVLGI